LVQPENLKFSSLNQCVADARRDNWHSLDLSAIHAVAAECSGYAGPFCRTRRIGCLHYPCHSSFRQLGRRNAPA
jgi:hypothetical protein